MNSSLLAVGAVSIKQLSPVFVWRQALPTAVSLLLERGKHISSGLLVEGGVSDIMSSCLLA
jgi:hypothetical protein